MDKWNDFTAIAVQERPLVDLRAPIEYHRGSFKNATNLPLMNDDERHQVGICYKEKGNEAAVALGHQLVSGSIKEQRVAAWLDYLQNCPDALLFCFRGGQRSKIAQQWILDAGGPLVPRLEGGYKALRRFLLEHLEPRLIPSHPIVLAGHTGSGKTIILRRFRQAIDLEELANHRGSAFGPQLTPQPTQIQFENDLSYRMITHARNGYRYMLIEDEGSHVGRCYLPKPLAEHFAQGDFIFLDVPLSERTLITMDEYVEEAQRQFAELYGEEKALQHWAEYIGGSIDKLKKRLGGEAHSRIRGLFNQALVFQRQTDNTLLHQQWVEALLRDYYDPMYEYQMNKKRDKAAFFGDRTEVVEFLSERYAGQVS